MVFYLNKKRKHLYKLLVLFKQKKMNEKINKTKIQTANLSECRGVLAEPDATPSAVLCFTDCTQTM